MTLGLDFFSFFFLGRRTESKCIYSELSICRLLCRTMMFWKWSNCLWEKIRAVLIWPLSPCWDEVQIIFFSFFFSTPLFSFCTLSAWICLCRSRQSRFHSNFRPLSKSAHPWPTSLRLFWPCNLSLFWSSMVPTQEWSAQRKKLMKSSFPLKCGSWASPLCTLSGLAAVSELHTVTTGRVFTDRGWVVFKGIS